MRLFATLTAGLLIAAMSPAQPVQQNPVTIARHALDLLLEQNYTELQSMFDQKMLQATRGGALRRTVSPLLTSLGKPSKIGSARVQRSQQYEVVIFPIQFASGGFNAVFSINPQGKIAGMFLRPGQPATQAKWTAPAYAHPDRFHSLAVTVGQTWRLPGTLLTPVGQGPFPGVVLVQGSGPHDRDETIGPNKPFRDLAEGLASQGIAVLRYDKRTLVYGRQMAASTPNVTVEQETIEDAINAVRLLQHQPGVASRRVFLLGHSLGGYLAPRIAEQDPAIAGLIILAGPARPLWALSLDQNREFGATPQQLAQVKQQIAKIQALKPGQANSESILGLPASYWLDLKNYNPTAAAKSLRMPMLILQGGRDFQVFKTDFDLWKSALAGKPNATFHYYPDLNHLFMPGQGKSTPAEYNRPGHVSVNVVDQIAAWIKAAGR
ncbi:MAG: alpha/beta fold hydrolase [Bryobacteraceae bacterium]